MNDNTSEFNKSDKLWIDSMEFCKRYCKCHQMPERSFFFKGYQFPLCARCTGIAVGQITGLILAPFCKLMNKSVKQVSLLMIPLAVDGTLQFVSNKYFSNNRRRFITGFLYGVSFIITFLTLITKSASVLQLPHPLNHEGSADELCAPGYGCEATYFLSCPCASAGGFYRIGNLEEFPIR